jgi:LysM repeat protein/cell wall-associated NlpC family hydrolase
LKLISKQPLFLFKNRKRSLFVLAKKPIFANTDYQSDILMRFQKQISIIFCLIMAVHFTSAQKLSGNQRISLPADSARIDYLSANRPLSVADSIINYGKLFLNTPYRYGSTGNGSFDCSGFTSYVFRNFGYDLDRCSIDQSRQFDTIQRDEIRKGDLVFFSGRRRSERVGHVGIVVDTKPDGSFDFIHASVHSGVTISNSQENYFRRRYIKANRVIDRSRLLAFNSTNQSNTGHYLPTNITKQIRKIIPAEYHRVRRGETLLSIAHRYGVSVAELKRDNHIRGNRINRNERLKVKDEQSVMTLEPVLLADNTVPHAPEAITSTSPLAPSISVKPENTVANASMSSLVTHLVKQGETLLSICNLYNITVEQLKKLNNLLDINSIHPGQKLKIETEVAETPKPDASDQKLPVSVTAENVTTTAAAVTAVQLSNPVLHRVEKGESLYSIAKLYNVGVDDLIKANDLQGTSLHTGQKLKITKNADANAATAKMEAPKHDILQSMTVRVKKGESLYTIAHENNISIDELKKLNNLSGNGLHPGQKLIVAQSATSDENSTASKSQKLSKNDASVKVLIVEVEKGQSLYNIANDNHVSVNDLKKCNNLSNNHIRPGQKLTIPLKDATASKIVKSTSSPKQMTVTHRVKSGESFYTIAEKYGCSVKDLKIWNHKTVNKIKPGEKLVIYSTRN